MTFVFFVVLPFIVGLIFLYLEALTEPPRISGTYIGDGLYRDVFIYPFKDSNGVELNIKIVVETDGLLKSRRTIAYSYHKPIDKKGYFDVQKFLLRLIGRYVHIKGKYYKRESLISEMNRRLKRNGYKYKLR